MADTPTKTASKRVSSPKRKSKRRQVTHDEIAERAYFIYLEEGRRDQLDNWLRAERELTAA